MHRARRRITAKKEDSKELAALAESYRRGGRLDKAEQKYREAIDRDPGLIEAQHNLAMVLQEQGRAAEATAQFARTAALCPADTRILLNFARALAAQDRFDDAARLFGQAIAESPDHAEAHFGLALSLAHLGAHGEAELHYRRVLQLEPANVQAQVHLGLSLVDQGRIVEAFEQAQIIAHAETSPGFPHKSFGILLARTGCPDGAHACFENHLLLTPEDEDEIALLLATVGGALPERTSVRQIERIYASKAEQWDQGARGAHSYQAHRLVATALQECRNEPVGKLVDLGCGTGLVGELLRDRTERLIGVDVSEPMLAQARQKEIYDQLDRADLQVWLGSHPASSDAIVCAAALIHFGDLDAVFSGAASCLREGGLFAFTLFPNDDDQGAVAAGPLNGLAQSGCFRHGSGYVTRLAERHGFAVALSRRAHHEHVGNLPVDGRVFVLRK